MELRRKVTIIFHVPLFALYILKCFMSVFHIYIWNKTESTNDYVGMVVRRLSFHHALQPKISTCQLKDITLKHALGLQYTRHM